DDDRHRRADLDGAAGLEHDAGWGLEADAAWRACGRDVRQLLDDAAHQLDLDAAARVDGHAVEQPTDDDPRCAQRCEPVDGAGGVLDAYADPERDAAAGTGFAYTALFRSDDDGYRRADVDGAAGLEHDPGRRADGDATWQPACGDVRQLLDDGAQQSDLDAAARIDGDAAQHHLDDKGRRS